MSNRKGSRRHASAYMEIYWLVKCLWISNENKMGKLVHVYEYVK